MFELSGIQDDLEFRVRKELWGIHYQLGSLLLVRRLCRELEEGAADEGGRRDSSKKE